jgi:hypothetical protein
LVLLFYLIFNGDYVFPANTDVLENSLRNFELHLIDFGAKGRTNDIYIYTLGIGEDGIIRSITSTNEYHEYCYIRRDNNSLNIKTSEENPFITYIKWDNNTIYTKAEYGRYAENNFAEIKVKPENQIIFASLTKKMQRINALSLKEESKKANGSVSTSVFSNDSTINDYMKGEHDWKFEYTKNRGFINAAYFFNMEKEYYLKYEPDVKIIMNDVSLHSKDETINVINYLILENFYIRLVQILFPIIFLENPFSWDNWIYTASSYLKERNMEYPANNMAEEQGLPWASANGYGIGEKLVIDMVSKPSNKLLLINGFISNEKPNLFNDNSRLKQIKIVNLNNKRNKTVLLKDTKDPQIIDIGELQPGEGTKIEIEVLSVYEGSRFKDLCIQAILPSR